MVSTGDKWVRIFDIPDTSKHKKGFTLYKVVSMLYPENCPDAITKITVWKRYNDFKKLHKEIKLKYHVSNRKEKFPSLPNAPFFKRFDSAVVKERQIAILHFLEFVAGISSLYTSTEFVDFFKTSHTPIQMVNSTISSIRAELHLPEEPEFFPFHTPSSDDECTLSDTDSVTTLSSLTSSLQVEEVSYNYLLKNTNTLNQLSRQISLDNTMKQSSNSHDSLAASTIASLDRLQNMETQIFPTPPTTPNTSNHSTQYILSASEHINLATQFEIDKKYEDAFTEYKLGIDILLKNVKVDENRDRREMVRHQLEKYLLRAEKIYNLHLSHEMKNINEITQRHEAIENTKSFSDLYKYKVVKVIGSAMLVIHTEIQKLFYVKVIQKTTNFSCEKLILPDNVPYMVKLNNYYISENAVFLILEYCSGSKLTDYVKQFESSDSLFEEYSVFTSDDKIATENESEGSYTDLVNEYAATKTEVEEIQSSNNRVEKIEDVVLENEDSQTDKSSSTSEFSEPGDLLEKSQKLLSSVDGILHKTVSNKKKKLKKINSEISIESRNLSLTSSRKSSVWWQEDFYFENPVPIQYTIKWSAQLILALEKLQALGIVCSHLHSKNFMIDDTGDLVLTYQCSISNNYEINMHRNNIMSKIDDTQDYSNEIDFWSLGMILYEWLVGRSLTEVHPEESNLMVLYIPKYVSIEGRSLLKQLLLYQEQTAPRIKCIEDIKTHPFFSSVSWNSMISKNSF